MYQKISNQQIKTIRSLKLKKFRQEEQLFVAENTKIVQELILSALELIILVISEEKLPSFEPLLSTLNPQKVYVIDDKTLSSISSLSTPNGLLAVFKQPSIQPDLHQDIILYVDNLSDPGNLGTIIRLADWYGLSQVFCSPTTTEVYNPKTIQSTMGSIARVGVVYMDIEEILSNTERQVLLSSVDNGKSVWKIDNLPKQILIVIGSESHGYSPIFDTIPSQKIHILGFGGAESLNASVACGIILDNVMRVLNS